MSAFLNASLKTNVLYLNNTSNNNKIRLRAPEELAADYTLTLPSSLNSGNKFLKSDTEGNLEWATALEVVSSNAMTISDSGNVAFGTDSGSANIFVDSGNSIVFNVGGSELLLVSSTGANITASTESTSTSTGALVVNGGVGVSGNTTVGGNVIILSTGDDALTVSGGIDIGGPSTITGTLDVNDTTQSTSTTTGAVIVDGGVGIGSNLNVGGNLTINTSWNITDTTQSTSTSTGAFVVDGGMAVGSDATIGGNLSVSDNATLEDTTVNGNLTITATTESTSGSTGALIVNGGAGITGNVNITGNLTVDKITYYQEGLFFGDNNEFSISNSSGNLVVKNTNADKDILFNVNVGGEDTTMLRLDNANSAIRLEKKIVNGIDLFSDSTATTTNLWNGSNVASTKQIVLNTSNTRSNYSVSEGTNGQKLNIFFTSNTNGSNARVDFGSSNLYAGSGVSRYLQFNKTGQSASLIYLDYPTYESLNGWRIINTGALVLDS